jgi:hypothetical protein
MSVSSQTVNTQQGWYCRRLFVGLLNWMKLMKLLKKAPAKECDHSERDTFMLPSIRVVCGLTKVLLESHQLKKGLGARTLLISLEMNKNLEFFNDF